MAENMADQLRRIGFRDGDVRGMLPQRSAEHVFNPEDFVRTKHLWGGKEKQKERAVLLIPASSTLFMETEERYGLWFNPLGRGDVRVFVYSRSSSRLTSLRGTAALGEVAIYEGRARERDALFITMEVAFTGAPTHSIKVYEHVSQIMRRQLDVEATIITEPPSVGGIVVKKIV